MDTDCNLMFGVLALQAGLIDADQFVDACTIWASRKDAALADLLIARGWIEEGDRVHIEYLLERKIHRHGGDAKASLAAMPDAVKRSLAALNDADIARSLADLPAPDHTVLSATVDHVPEPAERYQLMRLHATGGIGRIWLAHDTQLHRPVALKELRPERAQDATAARRFFREARITGQLEHPGVVPVYELGRQPSQRQPLYAMRFLGGRTLSERVRAYHDRRRLRQAEPLEFIALLNAFVTVCNTVAYAHSRGVIHRDLKGANVILGDFGEVFVVDWGLARLLRRCGDAGEEPVAHGPDEADAPDLTTQGEALGTPAYMAPEQAAGLREGVDERADVYGLGAILYEILTGEPPFAGHDVREVLRRVREDAPVAPRLRCADVPPGLDRICLCALAKHPADRQPSAAALAREVQGWQEEQRRLAEESLRETERRVAVSKEKLASIGLLSAGVAHEINNPLSYVCNNLVVLERDIRGVMAVLNVYEKAQDDLARVNSAAARQAEALAQEVDLAYVREHFGPILTRTREGLQRITRIVQSLRGLARADEPTMVETRVPDLVDMSLEMIRGRLKRRGINVEVDYGPTVVRCVPTQISQVLLNLIVNALQAVEAKWDNAGGLIRITTETVGKEVRIEVSDNGCGILPEHLPKVFDPFLTTQRPGEGTGLGLSVTHGIVTGHGGRIEVDSRPREGSRFRVFLPQHPVGEDTPAGPATAE
jgi:signal transduction histidine kinase/tRNA A-37 threonylcarbamoyl transferase component Bud32